jgi:hypothetical protein
VRDKALSLPGLNITTVSVPIDAVDHTPYIEAVIRMRLNIMVIANRRINQVSAFANHPFTLNHSTGTGALIVYLNELDYVPNVFPQGCFVIDEVESGLDNRTAFLARLGEIFLHRGSIVAYDAIKTLALAIENASSLGPVDRDSIITALRNIDFWADSGHIKFDSNQNRLESSAEILNSNSSASTDPLQLSMCYNGTHFWQVSDPTFPANSMVPTDDKLVFIPIVTLLSLTSSAIPASSRARIKSTFDYYIHWINQQPDLLPDKTKLVSVVIDDKGMPSLGVQYSVLAQSIGAASVFGDYSTTMTAVIQGVVASYGIPHLTTIAASSLSDNELFPTLTRTVSVTNSEGEMLIALAKHWGWTELTIVSTATGADSAAQTLLTRGPLEGITIENHLVLGDDESTYPQQLADLWTRKPQIVILLIESHVFPFLKAFHASNYKPAAVITDLLASLDTTSYAQTVGVPVSMFEGWLTLHTPVGSGELWDQFITDAKAADPVQWGSVPIMLEYVLSSATEIDAYIVIAKSIKKIVEAGIEATNGTALLEAIRSFNEPLYSGHLSFNHAGDRDPIFDLFNNYNSKLLSAGRWTSKNGISDLSSTIVWPDGTHNVPLSYIPRDRTWLKWSSGAGIALGLVAALGLAVCGATLFAIYMWRESPIITSATYEFLILMLFGSALGFGSTFTWIGEPRPYICALRIWLPPIAFLLIVTPLIAKTWRLWKIFNLSDFKVTPVPLSTLIIMVTALVLVQIIICVFWISMGTVQPELVNDLNDKTQAYVLCKANLANRISSYVTFGYIGLVLVVGCYLAYKIRKLPRDFNESKWIARTMYNIFLFAGLIIILGYALSRHYVVVLILICVCTLAICYGSIMLMMVPKIWTLWLRPEKRSSSSEGSTKNTELRSRTGTRGTKASTDRSRTKSTSKNHSASKTSNS